MKLARPTWCKVWISLVYCLCWISLVAASNFRTLNKIEVFSNEGSEQVSLEFKEKFIGNPTINFETGSISVDLDSVKKDSQLPSFKVIKGDSLIEKISVIQVPKTNYVRLHILLKSSLTKLEFPEISYAGNNLNLIFHENLYNRPILSSMALLNHEMQQLIKIDRFLPKFSTKVWASEEVPEHNKDFPPFQIENWGETILTLVISLLFVLLLIYLIAFLYNRFFNGRFSSMKGKIKIRQISSYYVGPKQKVIVFDFNGRMFACGVTPSSINLIAELFDEIDQEILSSNYGNENILEKEDSKINANSKKNIHTKSEKTKKFDPILNNEQREFENPTDIDKKSNEIFLKSNSDKEIKSNESLKSDGFTKPLKTSFEKIRSKTDNKTNGNKIMYDFARKLNERLKFLKPIK